MFVHFAKTCTAVSYINNSFIRYTVVVQVAVAWFYEVQLLCAHVTCADTRRYDDCRCDEYRPITILCTKTDNRFNRSFDTEKTIFLIRLPLRRNCAADFVYKIQHCQIFCIVLFTSYILVKLFPNVTVV